MYAARLRTSLPLVRERIEAARVRAGREGAVEVVGVTKGHPIEAVLASIEAGLTACGENRAQELAAKAEALEGRPEAEGVEWHLIGHLQRNKVRLALPLFSLIHSIDSPRLARELSKEATVSGRVVEGLMQVNTSGEGSKGGFAEEEAVEAVAGLTGLPGLRITGLMTMAPLTEEEAVLRETFRRARRLFERCGREVPAFEARHLSMGMSNDYEVAVEEGSTMVRLGTVLFGERQT